MALRQFSRDADRKNMRERITLTSILMVWHNAACEISQQVDATLDLAG